MMYCRLLLLSVFMLMSIYVVSNETDSLLKALDQSIDKREYYIRVKEARLAQLKAKMNSESDLEEKYFLSKAIMDEYSYYISDSALYYSRIALELASRLNNLDYWHTIRFNQAYLLCYPRLYHESFRILGEIELDKLSLPLKCYYYYTQIYVYHLLVRDLSYEPYSERYVKKIRQYIDLFLEIADEDTYEYLSIMALKSYWNEDYEEVKRISSLILARDDISPERRAETLYRLGGTYLDMGRLDDPETINILIQSSILSNELAITKNPPLLYLTSLLMRNKLYVDYADRYIGIAIEDVQKFSSQYKIKLMERTYSGLQVQHNKEIKEQRRELEYYLTGLFFLFFVVFIITCILYFYNVALKKTRKELFQTNLKLRDANRIKESYISHFLNEYSSHIQKMDNYKKHIVRQLNLNHSLESVRKEATSSLNNKDELQSLYSGFDKSILDLYPDFVERVNELLKEDQKYVIKNDDNSNMFKLNAELRILALIRLGIKDNKQIASFLRITVQTVYNYRSKAKSRAINEATFEEDILKIGTL